MAVFKSNGVCVKRARVKKTDRTCGDDPVGDDPGGDDPVGDDPTEDPERERCCPCSQRSIIIPLNRHPPTDRSPLRRFCARAEHERCGVAVLAVSAPSSSRSTVIPPPTDPSSLPRNPRHSSRSHPWIEWIEIIQDTLPDPIPLDRVDWIETIQDTLPDPIPLDRVDWDHLGTLRRMCVVAYLGACQAPVPAIRRAHVGLRLAAGIPASTVHPTEHPSRRASVPVLRVPVAALLP